jgi:hypothetical protein
MGAAVVFTVIYLSTQLSTVAHFHSALHANERGASKVAKLTTTSKEGREN